MEKKFNYLTVNTFHYALNKLYADAFQVLEDDPNCPFVCLVIDSPGGHVWNLQTWLDSVDNCSKPVMTILSGWGASCGAVLSTVGTKGLRIIGDNSTMLIHQCSGMAWGTSAEVMNEAKNMEQITNDYIYNRFDMQAGKDSGYTRDLLMNNFNTDLILSADQAIGHGFMDIKMGRNKALNNAFNIYNDWLLKKKCNDLGG